MKFGRKARIHDERVPKLSKLKRLTAPPVLPPAIDYTASMPSWLGMFGNDALGDCTCAAVLHALQVWTANATPPMEQDPDHDAVQLYSESCGYVPGNPSTDQGGIEQEVLAYWVNTGAPVGPTGAERQKLSAFVEIDQRNLEDIKQAIFEGGLCYIGFLVPASFDFGPVWSYNPNANNEIVAGHAVVLTGYNDASRLFTLISWGQKYQMTYDFFSQFCDEAYLLANQDWINATGRTPAGLSLTDLEALMDSLNWNSPSGARRQHRRRKRRRERQISL